MQSCIEMNTKRHFMTTVINIYRLLHVYMSCPFYAAPSNKVLSSFPTRKCLSCPKLLGHDRPMHINAVGCCIGVICLISRDRLQPSPPSWPATLQEDWGSRPEKSLHQAVQRGCLGIWINGWSEVAKVITGCAAECEGVWRAEQMRNRPKTKCGLIGRRDTGHGTWVSVPEAFPWAPQHLASTSCSSSGGQRS